MKMKLEKRLFLVGEDPEWLEKRKSPKFTYVFLALLTASLIHLCLAIYISPFLIIRSIVVAVALIVFNSYFLACSIYLNKRAGKSKQIKTEGGLSN